MKHVFSFNGKAITVQQPWASAIAFAGKDVENRTRQTHYRGPIAIHAAGTIRMHQLDLPVKSIRGGDKFPISGLIAKGRRKYGLETEDIPLTSHVIAIGMRVDCVQNSRSPWSQREAWHLVIEGIVPIQPVPMDGALGLWQCGFYYEPLKRRRR